MKNKDYKGEHPNLVGENCSLYYFNAYTNQYVMEFLKYFGEEYNIVNTDLWVYNKWDENYITDQEFFNYIKYCLKSFVGDYTKYHGIRNDKSILRLTSHYEDYILYLFKKDLFHYDFSLTDPSLDIFVKIYGKNVSHSMYRVKWLVQEFDEAIFFFTLLEMYPKYKTVTKNNFYKMVFDKTLKRLLIFWTQFSGNKIMELLGPCLIYGIVPEEWHEEKMYKELSLYRMLTDEPAIRFIIDKIHFKLRDLPEYESLEYSAREEKIELDICKSMLYVKGNGEYELWFKPFKSKYIDKDDICYGIDYEITTDLRKEPGIYDMKGYLRTIRSEYKDFLYTALKNTHLDLRYMYGTTVHKFEGGSKDIYVNSFHSYITAWLELGLQKESTLKEAIDEIDQNVLFTTLDIPINDNVTMVKSVCKTLTSALLSEETVVQSFLNTMEMIYRPKKRFETYSIWDEEITNTPNVPDNYYTIRLCDVVNMYRSLSKHKNMRKEDHILIRNGIGYSWDQDWYLRFNFIKELLIETCLKVIVCQFKLDLFYTLQEFLKTEVNENYILDLNKCKIETVKYTLDKNFDTETNNDDYYTLL